MNSFDEKFSQKVKEVFDNYNADHLVDAGWQSFRQKQGGQKRIGAFLPFWAKVATLTILLALGSFVTIRLTRQVDEYSVPLVEIEKLQDEVPSPANDKTISKDKLANEEDISHHLHTIKTRDQDRTITYVQISETVIAEEIESSHIIQNDDDKALEVTDQVLEPIAYLEEEKKEVQFITDVERSETDTTSESESLEPSLAQNILDYQNIASTRSRTKFGAGFSGMIAIAEDMISTSPGVAIGLYAQRKIADRISIQPGLALAKHTYSMENISNSMDYTTPTFNNLAGQVYSSETTMDIIAMEIPINFIFDILKRHEKNIYVSAGMSTIVYLNQSYTNLYSNIYRGEVYNSETNEVFQTTLYTTDKLNSHYGMFNHADLFGLANLAMGYSFPIGKNSMLIEPFVQIPLGEITSIDLRMGFGGVSLKYIFLR